LLHQDLALLLEVSIQKLKAASKLLLEYMNPQDLEELSLSKNSNLINRKSAE
jgi:hypothetical protein